MSSLLPWYYDASETVSFFQVIQPVQHSLLLQLPQAFQHCQLLRPLRSAGLLIEGSELLAVFSRPYLLVAALVTTIVGDRLGIVTTLSDVLGEVTFADGPATECRDVRVWREDYGS